MEVYESTRSVHYSCINHQPNELNARVNARSLPVSYETIDRFLKEQGRIFSAYTVTCKQENRARSRTGIKFSDKLVCTDKRFLLRLVRSRARFFVYMSQYKQKNPILFFQKVVHRFAANCQPPPIASVHGCLPVLLDASKFFAAWALPMAVRGLISTYAVVPRL